MQDIRYNTYKPTRKGYKKYNKSNLVYDGNHSLFKYNDFSNLISNRY